MVKTAAEETEALREATREAHGAIQEMKELLKRLARERDEFSKMFETSAVDVMKKGLADWQEIIAQHIDLATKKVYERFDTLADTLLGEGDRAQGQSLRALYEAGMPRVQVKKL